MPFWCNDDVTIASCVHLVRMLDLSFRYHLPNCNTWLQATYSWALTGWYQHQARTIELHISLHTHLPGPYTDRTDGARAVVAKPSPQLVGYNIKGGRVGNNGIDKTSSPVGGRLKGECQTSLDMLTKPAIGWHCAHALCTTSSLRLSLFMKTLQVTLRVPLTWSYGLGPMARLSIQPKVLSPARSP